MESWRKVWREGIQPHVSNKGLLALMEGLRLDDGQLVQGCTTVPFPMQEVLDWQCNGACAIGYIGWKAYGAETVGQVEEFLHNVWLDADQKLGEVGATRYFINWYDDCDRDEMRRAILSEIARELCIRSIAEPVITADKIWENNYV